MRAACAVVVGAMALFVVAVATRYGSPDAGDHLEVIAGYSWAEEVAVGQVFVDGLSLVRPRVGPVEIVRIVPLPADGEESGLTYLGAYIASPERRVGGHAGRYDFPPTDPDYLPAVPAPGADLTPEEVARNDGHAYGIVLGFEVTRSGRYVNQGVRIEYRYDGEAYVVEVPNAFAVCAGWSGPCTPPPVEGR